MIAARAIEDHVELTRVLFDQLNYDWDWAVIAAGDMIGATYKKGWVSSLHVI